MDEEAIRKKYEKLGVDRYYKKYGADYTNPHFLYIQSLLENNESQIDYTRVFDFCCGAGEVTQVLGKLGYGDTVGCDPYTQKAFSKNTGKTCLNFTFDDIIKGKYKATEPFTAIICSFAMHLCPEDKLYPLISRLFQITPQLVIITPHKRPVLEELTSVSLDYEDFVLTERGKKVRLKLYSLSY